VAVNYRSGQEAAEAIAGEIGGLAVQADVSSPEEAQALVERVENELGDVDALVNNAGVTRDTLIARMSDEDWEVVVDTNLRGTFNTCRAVARKMLRRKTGSIVNLSSVVGVHGNPGQANYAASKAGIIGLTKALARELGSRGVRVNAIAPGYIATELTDVLNEQQRGLILQNTPLGRLGEPEDVAGAVRFLCSDEAAFITGEVLLVDGGLGM
jgi:3-oxoacyl-[acyl-carrier protein] reductase